MSVSPVHFITGIQILTVITSQEIFGKRQLDERCQSGFCYFVCHWLRALSESFLRTWVLQCICSVVAECISNYFSCMQAVLSYIIILVCCHNHNIFCYISFRIVIKYYFIFSFSCLRPIKVGLGPCIGKSLDTCQQCMLDLSTQRPSWCFFCW